MTSRFRASFSVLATCVLLVTQTTSATTEESSEGTWFDIDRLNAGLNAPPADLADVENGRAMTPETPMLAASIGKTFVATTVLALETEGRLPQADLLADGRGLSADVAAARLIHPGLSDGRPAPASARRCANQAARLR